MAIHKQVEVKQKPKKDWVAIGRQMSERQKREDPEGYRRSMENIRANMNRNPPPEAEPDVE